MATATPAPLEMGLDTFGDVTSNDDGTPKSYAQVIRDVVEEGVLADHVGVNFIGIGEHHRDDFAVSAPDVVLAGIASRTANIHLGSAVTVLSSEDAVRCFSASPPLMPSPTVAPRSSSVEARSPSHSPCLVSPSATTNGCSRRSSSSWLNF